MTTRLDLGMPGRWLEPVVAHNTSDKIVGYIENHPHAVTGAPCRGWLNVDPEGDAASTWQVLQVEPLTLDPSISCRACGNHGYVRNGKWEFV